MASKNMSGFKNRRTVESKPTAKIGKRSKPTKMVNKKIQSLRDRKKKI